MMHIMQARLLLEMKLPEDQLRKYLNANTLYDGASWPTVERFMDMFSDLTNSYETEV